MVYLKEPVILVAVGDKIRELRKQKQMSQEDLALKAGIAISQVGRIERGLLNPSISTLFVISMALEIEPKQLFDFDQLFVKKSTMLERPGNSQNKKNTEKRQK